MFIQLLLFIAPVRSSGVDETLLLQMNIDPNSTPSMQHSLPRREGTLLAKVHEDRQTAKDSDDHSVENLGQDTAIDRSSSFANLSSTKRIWVNAFGRSGSSTLFQGIKAYADENSMKVFSLFEPSHNLVEGGQKAELSGKTFSEIMNCDISSVKEVWAGGPKTDEGGATWSSDLSPEACKSADLVVLKTIRFGHATRTEALPLIDNDMHLRELYIIRDPRGIFASQKKLNDGGCCSFREASISGMLHMCDAFMETVENPHPRVHIVGFEIMTSKPMHVMRNVYKFLQLPFGPSQEAWVQANFDADCDESHGFTTCRTDSKKSIDHWKDVLSDTELRAFETHASCRKLAEKFHYEMPVIVRS